MAVPVHDDRPAPRGAADPFAALLAAAASGDARAFEAFYSDTARNVLGFVRRITGDALAEDVVADSYFQAWREAGRFDPSRGSAMAWLMTIARSRALDRLRQESLRHAGAAGAPEFDADADVADAAPTPPDLLDTVAAHTRLHEALRALSKNERWVLGLAYFREHTQSEIAAITGMPIGTVKSHMTRAQARLREALGARNA